MHVFSVSMGDPVFWLIALVVFLLIEVTTLGLTTIWFAAGALITFFAALLHVSVPFQIVIFLVSSVIMLIFTRPVAEKHFNKDRHKTNVNSLIGKTGKVTEAIDNFEETGAVRINGIDWTARCEQGDKISQGEKVVICRVEGVKVFVKPSISVDYTSE